MIILQMEVDGEYIEVERLPAADRKPVQTSVAPSLSDLLLPVGFLNGAPVHEIPAVGSQEWKRLRRNFEQRKTIQEQEINI